MIPASASVAPNTRAPAPRADKDAIFFLRFFVRRDTRNFSCRVLSRIVSESTKLGKLDSTNPKGKSGTYLMSIRWGGRCSRIRTGAPVSDQNGHSPHRNA